jgi:hypothetical protein
MLVTDRNELALFLKTLKKRGVQVLELVISLLESLDIVAFATLLPVYDASFS